jgi:hypothetical protein
MAERLRTGNFHWPLQAKLLVLYFLYSRFKGKGNTCSSTYYSAYYSTLTATHPIAVHLLLKALTFLFNSRLNNKAISAKLKIK